MAQLLARSMDQHCHSHQVILEVVHSQACIAGQGRWHAATELALAYANLPAAIIEHNMHYAARTEVCPRPWLV